MRLFHTIFLFLILTSVSSGQVHNFRNYSIEDGLTQSRVSTIAQDKSGYIWLGTLGGGVCRFDGKQFIPYSMQDGLSSNIIYKLICDSKGIIWAGTSQGISRFNGKRFEKIATPYNIVDKAILDITEDKTGNLWFATNGYGVIRFDGLKYHKFGIQDGLGFSEVSSIYCDKNNTLWAGSSGYGIAKFNNEFFENVTEKAHLNGDYIREISEGPRKNLIVFTEKGAQEFNGKTFQSSIDSFPPDVKIYHAFENGDQWLATSQSIYRISEKKEPLTLENGLSSNQLLCLFEDNEKNIWFGFDGSGCSVFSGDRFIHFDRYSGLPGNSVNTVYEDKSGIIWVGTQNGLAYNEGEGFHPLHLVGSSSYNVKAIIEDREGNLWIGTDNSIIRTNSPSCQVYSQHSEGNIQSVHFLFQDPYNGELFAGTNIGVLKYNGITFEPAFQSLLPACKVNSIRMPSREDLWINTEKGAFRYNGESLVHLPLRDEFGKLDAIDVWKDPRGNFWIITGRGIVIKRKDESYEHIKKRDGLCSENLTLILYDNQSLWIGSDHGLDKITPNEDWSIKSIEHYGKTEGLRGVECNPAAGIIDKNGMMWIGTTNGATRYNHLLDLENGNKPVVHITGLRLNYDKTNWTNKYPNQELDDQLPNNIVLNYSDNHITFDFIAFQYKNPDNLYYRFFLEGFDEKWSPPTKENQATYSNIPPGKYKFMVAAKTSNGEWGVVDEFIFEVDAPFWRKKWFYALLMPLMVIFFYLILLFRTRNLNRAKRRLEEKVRIRTQELNQQKDELEKLSIVASNMNEGVLICGPDGSIEWINDSFFRMAGYSKEDFNSSVYGKAQTLQELSSFPGIDQVVKGFVTKKETVVFDSSHFNKEGKTIWTRGSIVPIYNKRFELEKIIVIYTDITDRKLAELALEQSNKDFLDSVKYARRIQEAILPDIHRLEQEYPDSFMFYQPRDIVSGDFYWFTKINNVFLVAVADCTGHGVPGAFMSLIGNEFLHQISNDAFVTGPEQCLHFLDKQVTRSLHQEGEARESRDGMDIGLCALHTDSMLCQFSGANIPMYLVREGEVLEYDSLKESIGGFNERGKEFYSHEFLLLPGDCIYMTTDGFIDQFGGEKGKKFMRRRFKEMLVKIHALPMKEQQEMIQEEFRLWAGDRKQIDDVLVIGIRIH